MTRKQVAVRLGKSLATVRRLEGVLLYPRLDHRGVHRFDPDDVDALAADVQNGRVKIANELRPAAHDLEQRGACMRCAGLEREIAAARSELGRLRDAHAHTIRKLQGEREVERARFQGEAAALAAEVDSFLNALDA